MIRLLALWLVVSGIFVYTWRDWYRGLCGLILLMAVFQHPDMPKEIFGIGGLNPWNLLMANVLAAWFFHRRMEGLRWDLPRPVTILLVLYLGIVLVGFARIIGDTSVLEWYYNEAGLPFFINDYLINTIKWVLPALLLYDGCRSEDRFRVAVVSLLAVYVLLGLQVAKHMPPWIALDADLLEHRGLRVLARNVGYHRVNLSAMLSGASWAILSARILMPVGLRWPIVLTALFVMYAQLMTGGRAGYGAWVAVGIVMSLLKWRRYLLLFPVAALVVMLVAPGIAGRALTGLTSESRDSSQRLDELEEQGRVDRGEGDVDSYTLTAGRSIAWPQVIRKIQEEPFTGYGRQAMLRSGLAVYIWETFNEAFPHPHNAYLELFFDNGLPAGLIVLSFYALMLWYSVFLFVSRQSTTCTAVGGISTALILSLLVSAMGSQSFYPREGWVGLWCAMFLMLRVKVESGRRKTAAFDATLAATAVAPVAVTGRWAPQPTMVRAQTVSASRPQIQREPQSLRTSPSPAFGGTRIAQITWKPRSARTGTASVTPPSIPSTVALACPQTPASPQLRPARFAGGYLFSNRVTDPLVWEDA